MWVVVSHNVGFCAPPQLAAGWGWWCVRACGGYGSCYAVESFGPLMVVVSGCLSVWQAGRRWLLGEQAGRQVAVGWSVWLANRLAGRWLFGEQAGRWLLSQQAGRKADTHLVSIARLLLQVFPVAITAAAVD
eukprot:GHVU01169916.1.p1 GENE.GHVU01169916.1~~GHVU01169916.1.p1  ORF type:complete len:132 (+),score=14.31 GHVU01169916.1:625-1020(+)